MFNFQEIRGCRFRRPTSGLYRWFSWWLQSL